MLLFGAIVSGIALAPGLQEWLKGVPFCKNSTATSALFVGESITINCSNGVGYLAVYRICFAFACFFALMAVMMIGAKSSRDGRAGIQNGFWGIKFIIVIAIAIGAFFIPDGSFGTFWMWIGLIGGVVFILIQLVLLVDFAHSWAETWVGEYTQEANKSKFYILLKFQFHSQATTKKMNPVDGIVPFYRPHSFNTQFPLLASYSCTSIMVVLSTTSSSHST